MRTNQFPISFAALLHNLQLSEVISTSGTIQWLPLTMYWSW